METTAQEAKMRFRLLGIVVLLLGLMSLSASAREIGVKAGGATVFDPVRWGGHLSFEIPLSDEYPTNLAPFIEVYNKNGNKLIPVGIALIYKARISDAGGTIYFGVGGGALLVRGQPAFGLVKSTDGIISAALGLSLGFGDRFGAFTQMRWFRSFEDQTADNLYAVHFGLSFNLGGE